MSKQLSHSSQSINSSHQNTKNTPFDELIARQSKHVLYTWTAQKNASPIPISGGKGAFFYGQDGERWFDFESQVFNCNLGHQDSRVINAIKTQAEDLACAHPAAAFEAKAELGELLAEVTPGDINRFFLCLSGAEAIENAYKIARLLTGRKKVIARRRSYHGASMGALSLTGDPRRQPFEPGLWGVLRAEDPYCYRCPFDLKRDCCSLQCATHIEHIIEMEGPDTIAAIFAEGVTGSNGGFIPPPEYWPKLREICDRHGILLIADEVFSGFGRTGKWFAVNHWNIVPDMIAMAKGVTSGYAPLGVLGIRESLAQHFNDEVLWCGLTSYAHPISCATAVATIKAYQEDGLIDNAHVLGTKLTQRLQSWSKYSWYGDSRCLGLFGTLELADHCSEKQLQKLKVALHAQRIHILLKGRLLFITPPLCIQENELHEGLDLILSCLDVCCANEP
jgi:taurine---2-oxoglutarate transaminase